MVLVRLDFEAAFTLLESCHVLLKFANARIQQQIIDQQSPGGGKASSGIRRSYKQDLVEEEITISDDLEASSQGEPDFIDSPLRATILNSLIKKSLANSPMEVLINQKIQDQTIKKFNSYQKREFSDYDCAYFTVRLIQQLVFGQLQSLQADVASPV